MTALTAYVSEKANKELTDYLLSKGLKIVSVSKTADVSDPVSCHPDIYYCLLKNGIYEGDPSLLSETYPGDVLYNAAALGPYLICSKNTSEDLIEKSGLTPVFVRQGYVKCNLAILDDSHVITEDRGIAKTLGSLPGIECLLIDEGGVALPGFDHGFIGGATGRMGNKMIFNGDLSSHKNFLEIDDFCRSCGLEVIYFDSYPLTDIGSILITA